MRAIFESKHSGKSLCTCLYLNNFSVLLKHWLDVDWPPKGLGVEIDVVFRKDVDVDQVEKVLFGVVYLFLKGHFCFLKHLIFKVKMIVLTFNWIILLFLTCSMYSPSSIISLVDNGAVTAILSISWNDLQILHFREVQIIGFFLEFLCASCLAYASFSFR